MNKVLICTPISKRHDYCIDRFLDRVRNMTHPVHLLLYDNTLDNGEYFQKLKDKTPESWITVKRHTWNPKKWNAVQMLADVKEKMRKYFLFGRYDYYWDLAVDMFPPKNMIERYISHDKDGVGAVVHMYTGRRTKPAIFPWRGNVEDSGHIIVGRGIDYMSWKELKRQDGLIRVYGVGAPFMKRKVLKVVPWRTHPILIYGEDLWFFTEANDKGFEFWCDTDIRIKHENIAWTDVPHHRTTEIEIAMGPINAEGFEYVNRTETPRKELGREPERFENITAPVKNQD